MHTQVHSVHTHAHPHPFILTRFEDRELLGLKVNIHVTLPFWCPCWCCTQRHQCVLLHRGCVYLHRCVGFRKFWCPCWRRAWRLPILWPGVVLFLRRVEFCTCVVPCALDLWILDPCILDPCALAQLLCRFPFVHSSTSLDEGAVSPAALFEFCFVIGVLLPSGICIWSSEMSGVLCVCVCVCVRAQCWSCA